MNNELRELRNSNTEKIIKLIDDKNNLRLALECLKDEYIQYVDDACHCDEYDDNEECSYCYAVRILKETK